MPDDELVAVDLLGFPIPDFVEARRHSEELQREFALLLAQADAAPSSVPARLLAVTRQLRVEYAVYAASQSALIEAAVASGLPTVDLHFDLPAAAAGAATTLAQLLDEADEFCRRGELLTLATPPRALRFRRWYLDEFVRQLDGAPPTPYDAYESAPT